jgi:mitochondrial import receptor subunit TOM70
LTADVAGAKEDLLTSIELVPSFTQSLVKIASVHMEQGDPKKAFECFEEAIKHDADDPDIYYHRGQGASNICHLQLILTLWSLSALHHE